MKDVLILVATHKKYQMPKDELYLPIHVGREGKEDIGYQGDNTGDNISSKNPNYCELTALYWAWKNLDVKYIGLCHYRRYFTNKSLICRLVNKKKWEKLILSKSEAEALLDSYDIILPKKRNYFIESVWAHYEHTQHIKDLEATKQVIEEKYPEYLTAFNNVMRGKKVHLYNMFIMEKRNFDRYCEWLFDILFELEKRIDISQYNTFHARVYGFISELLLDVWLSKENFRVKELKVINIEGINWPKKIAKFIISKVTGYKFSKI
jgi:hypothetical protein